MNYKQISIEYYRRRDNDFLINNIKNIINFILLIDDYRYKNISEIIDKYKSQFSIKLICFTLTLLFNNKILKIVNLNNSYIYC
jgi:hypothetical protein